MEIVIIILVVIVGLALRDKINKLHDDLEHTNKLLGELKRTIEEDYE